LRKNRIQFSSSCVRLMRLRIVIISERKCTRRSSLRSQTTIHGL
jgi:hypothetical protein